MAGDPVGAPAPSDVQPKGDWYGWQIMLADLGVITTLSVGGVLTGNSSRFAFVPITGGVAFYTAGPLVHVAHRNGQAARKSLVLRLLVPIGGAALGGVAGALIDSGYNHAGCSEGCAKISLGIAGFGAGMLGAMGADWVTAREPILDSEAKAPSWTPTLVVTRQSAGAGIMFRF